MIDPSGKAGPDVTESLSGLCGRRPAVDRAAGSRRHERTTAEFEAVRTLTAYLNLLSEQQREIEPLAVGAAAIADMLWARSRSLPHLLLILGTELFEIFAPVPF